MFITAQNRVHSTFDSVNKVVKYDQVGNVHIGRSIRAYLKMAHITYDELGDMINMSKSGVATLVQKSTIQTQTLQKISKALNHNFFKYFDEELDSTLANEAAEGYHMEPKRSRVVIDLEDGRVVNHRQEDEDLLRKILEQQKRQWEILIQSMPDVAKKMAQDPSLNPNNIDAEEGKVD